MERKSYLTNKAFRLFLGASILTALSAMLGNIIDGVVVSHLIDYDAMSATSLCKPIMQANYTIYQLIGLGASILVAKAMGQNDRRRMNSLFSMTIIVLSLFCIAEALVGVFAPELIVDAVCKADALKGYAFDYFTPIIIGTPLCVGVFFMGGFTAIDGAPKLVSVSMLVDNLLHIVMDIVLIQWCSMGVYGSAVATLIGHAVAIGIMLTHYAKGKSQYRLVMPDMREMRVGFTESCSTGLPFAVASICLTIYLYCTQNIISTGLGKESLFIFSVMLNIMTIYNMFVTGACQTMQQLAALQIGMGDHYGHRLTVGAAFRFLNISLGSAFVILLVFPQLIANIFDCPAELMDECCYGVRIYGLAFWLFCLLYLLMVNYKLLKRSALANFISLALSLTVIPVMWVNVRYMPDMVWWSNLIAYILVLIVVLVITLFVKRRDRNLVSVLLIPKKSSQSTFDLSFGYSPEAAHEAFDTLSQWLNEQMLDSNTILRIRVTAEELMENIVRHSRQKNINAMADVRIAIDGKNVTLALTDDGTPFNPVDYKDKGYGLILINKACSEISYKYQFGQNMTTLKFHN